MAASRKTAEKILGILVEEVGIDKAEAILERLCYETEGNKSYNQTVNALHKMAKEDKQKINEAKSAKKS